MQDPHPTDRRKPLATRGRTIHQGQERLFAGAAVRDPDVWSGRALQEDFADLSDVGLASMYPASHWSVSAPGHHGYQRACDLISVQASTGPSGSPVFARTGKTDPPSRLILSQTSAGKAYRSGYVIAGSLSLPSVAVGVE